MKFITLIARGNFFANIFQLLIHKDELIEAGNARGAKKINFSHILHDINLVF